MKMRFHIGKPNQRRVTGKQSVRKYKDTTLRKYKDTTLRKYKDTTLRKCK